MIELKYMFPVTTKLEEPRLSKVFLSLQATECVILAVSSPQRDAHHKASCSTTIGPRGLTATVLEGIKAW